MFSCNLSNFSFERRTQFLHLVVELAFYLHFHFNLSSFFNFSLLFSLLPSFMLPFISLLDFLLSAFYSVQYFSKMYAFIDPFLILFGSIVFIVVFCFSAFQ